MDKNRDVITPKYFFLLGGGANCCPWKDTYRKHDFPTLPEKNCILSIAKIKELGKVLFTAIQFA